MIETLQQQQAIYNEMLSHPALFTHQKPHKVAILGDSTTALVEEILKHTQVAEVWQSGTSNQNQRIQTLPNTLPANTFDIIIVTNEKNEPSFTTLHQALNADGILLYPSTTPFDLLTLKKEQDSLNSAGFFDIQLISFPQPDYPTGWRTAFMAVKQNPFRRIREKDIFNRTFSTHYYNFDVHKASLVLPEFMKEHLHF